MQNNLPAEFLGKRFCPGENKVGGECLVLECMGGWNADELENDFFILVGVMVSIEDEEVADDAAAEELTTAYCKNKINDFNWW